MSSSTGIEWTDATWNPVRGCSRVSAGCVHCYAERVAARFSGPGLPYEGLARQRSNGEPQWTGEVRVVEKHMTDPLGWRKPRRVFVNSMSDLFHEKVSDADLDRIFAVMALAPQHTFQVLTKRPERMAQYTQSRGVGIGSEADPIRVSINRDFTGIGDHRGALSMPLPNVWLGVSVEDQKAADERIPLLLQTPAAVRFLSCEPLLGPVDLGSFLWGQRLPCANCPRDIDCECGWRTRAENGEPSIAWVIVGGESGPGARSCDLAWMREIVAQCRAAGASVFVKQMGADVFDSDLTASGKSEVMSFRDRKGGDIEEWPTDLRVREFPAAEVPA